MHPLTALAHVAAIIDAAPLSKVAREHVEMCIQSIHTELTRPGATPPAPTPAPAPVEAH